MKKIAVLMTALFILFALNLTAYASDTPGWDDFVEDTPVQAAQPEESDVEDPDTSSENDDSILANIGKGVEDSKDSDALPESTGRGLLSDVKDRVDGNTQKPPGSRDAITPEKLSETTSETTSETVAPTELAEQQDTESKNQESAVEESDSSGDVVKIIVIIAGALLLIILIIILALLLRKKNPSADDYSGHGSGHGLALHVEVLSGYCWNAGFDFRLRRNLTIGTDHGCDLVFDDPQMLPMHAVITRGDNGVVLAECSDTGNTYIGGMKIFAPNTLRSGDIVTIGATSFRIFFE